MKLVVTISISLAIVMMLACTNIAQAQFTWKFPGILPPVSSGSVAWGDYNNDGALDVLCAGNGIAKVYRNYQPGFGEEFAAVLPGVSYASAAWGDYDNDGNLDILLTGLSSTGATTKIFRNTGSAFTEVYSGILPGVFYSSVAWRDFNNDGRLDILLTGFDGSKGISRIYLNTGTSFSEAYQNTFTGVFYGSVACQDFDNDGDMDVLISGFTGSEEITKIYSNTGNGFSEVYSGSLPGVYYGAVAWGDYDNDGRFDILLSGNTGSAKYTKLYRNTGSGFTHDLRDTAFVQVDSSAVAWGDYNNDGHLDLVVTGYADSAAYTKLYQNTGTSFVEDSADTIFTDVFSGAVAWGDFNSDSTLDLMLTGIAGGVPIDVAFYQNDDTLTNAPPVAPTGLTAFAVEGGITFRWRRSSDALTPTTALTYNLRVGTTSNGVDVLSPSADVPGGARSVAQFGNTGPDTSWTIKLSPGTYYYSVQAVDQGFAGSPFATERSIGIGQLFSASVTSIDFGNVNPGTTKYDSVTITNTGVAILQIDSIKIGSARFGISPQSSTQILPGRRQKYYCSFSPTTTGAVTDSIRFYDNAGGSPHKIAVSGYGAYARQSTPGFAISLDGTNDYIDVPDGTWFDANATVEAWVYLRSYNSFARLIDFGQGQANDNFVVVLSNSTTGRPSVHTYVGSSEKEIVSPTPAPLNTWFHIAVTYNDATHIGTIYVNGQSVASGTLLSPAAVTRNLNYIGKSNWSGGAYTNAIIDELSIWNTLRTAQDIQTDMTHTLLGSETGLLGYWRFDEGRGTQAGEAGTSTQAAATLINSPTWVVSDAPFPKRYLTTNATSLDFGSVEVGRNKLLSVTFTNTGDSSLSVSSITHSAAAYTITPASASIPGPGTQHFTITFTPSAIGTVRDTIHFTHDADGSPFNLVVTGTGTASAFAMAPTSLSFGSLSIGAAKTDSVTITNGGTSTLVVTRAATQTERFAVSPSSASISPGNSTKFYVTFSPVAMGSVADTLALTHNAAGSPHKVPLSGTGIQPVFAVAPTSINFGTMNIGTTKRDSITVSNTGTASFTVSSVVSSEADYSVTPTSGVVASGGSLKFYITFSPRSGGQIPGTITLNHSAGSPAVISVTGFSQTNPVNSVLSFPGIGGINVICSNISLGRKSFSFEFWAQRSVLNQEQAVLSEGLGWSNANERFVAAFPASGLFAFRFGGDDLVIPGTSDLLWHHWAGTYDVETGVRIVYRDGVELGRDVSSGGFKGNPYDFMIGGMIANGAPLSGMVDEVRLWDGVRTPLQIVSDMVTPVDRTAQTAIAAWNFDEGSGNKTYDMSGHHYTGTLIGIVSWARPAIMPPLLTEAADSVSELYTAVRWKHIPMTNRWYRIQRADPVLQTTVTLSTLSSADSIYNDYSGVRGRNYYYTVTMVNADSLAITRSSDWGRTIVYPPLSFTASDGLYADRVELTWASSSSITKEYQIFRNDSLLGTAPGDMFTYRDTRAIPGVLSSYRIVAADSGGILSQPAADSGWRGFISPVGNVTASYGLYPQVVKVVWAAPPGLNSVLRYRIYRDGVLYDSVTSQSTSYQNTLAGLSPEHHTYCVAAVAPGGNESILLCAEGGVHVLPPPAGVAASDNTYDNRVEVTWSDTTNLEDKYLVYRDGALIATLKANATSYNDYDSLGGITHTYWVRSATDSGGLSFDTLTRDNGTQSIILPPTDLAASNGDYEDRVVLVWKSGSTRTNLFKIFRDGKLIATKPGTTRGYFDFDCTTDSLHTYRVLGVTNFEVPSAADTASGRRILTAPTGVSATDGDNEEYTTITWTNNSSAYKGTRIRRSLSDSSGMVTLASLLKTGVASYNDSTGLSSVIYRYYVDAVDTIGGISYSSANTDGGYRQLLAPLAVEATNGLYEDKIIVTWRDTSKSEEGYRVYRNGSLLATLPSNTMYYVDEQPSRHGVLITYSIAAFDAYGTSASVSAAGKASVVAPLSFNASDGYSDRIQLTWTDASSIPGHFFDIARSRNDSTAIQWQVGGQYQGYADADINASEQYRYCIRTGVVEGGDTSYSDPVCDEGFMQIVVNPGVTPATGLNNPFVSAISVQSDHFGHSMAMSGNDALIGAPGRFRHGVEFFNYQNGAWKSVFAEPWGYFSSTLLNYPLAISSTHAVAGEPEYNVAVVYAKNTSANTWSRIYRVDPTSSPNTGYRTGYAVAMSDTQFFYSQPRRALANKGQGTIICLTKGSWSQTQTLTEGSTGNYDTLGVSMAANDSILAVGAVGQAGYPGNVYLFRKTNNPSLTIGKWDSLPPFKIASYDYRNFGSAVAISGASILVGSPDENAVWVYTVGDVTTSNIRILDCQKITPSDSAVAGQGFGTAVAIDGTNIVVGTTEETVYQFVFVSGRWIQQGKYAAADPTKSRNFGRAVAIAGSKGFIGSDNSPLPSGLRGGAIYPFYLVGTPQSATASDGLYQDRVHIGWEIDIANPSGFRIYRDGEVIKSVGADVHEYEDYDALPNQPYLYGVAAYSGAGETVPATDYGWRSADGSISGRIANKVGGAAESVKVNIDPSPNRSLLFDGVQGKVQIQRDTTASTIFGRSCTIEAWIKPSTTATEGIVGWGTSSPDYASVLRLVNGQLQYDWGGADALSVSSSPITPGSWHHVAATFDSATNTRKIYLDGELVATGSPTGRNMADNRVINIGVSYAGDYFEGQIDEIRIWEVARTQSQIQAAMYHPLVGTESGLTGYWPLDQDAGLVIADLTQKTRYGFLSGGVYWSEDHSPLDISALTDKQGNYTISNIPYGQTRTFKVLPTHGSHQFYPTYKTITLSRQSTVQNEVTFSDITAYNIAGIITLYDCPVPNVDIVVNGSKRTTTDKNGRYNVAVDPGSYTVEPRFTDHAFTPPYRSVVITQDTAGINFQDTKMRTLTGKAAGGCDRSIGLVKLEFFTPQRCFAETVVVNSAVEPHYSVSLPAQKYYARVIYVDPPAGLDRVDVRNFFNNLGTREMDLTTLTAGKPDTSMDFIYRAPITVEITGFGSAGACGVPILRQGLSYYPRIKVTENYGSGQVCPVDTGSVTIYDAVNDRENIPITFPIDNGVAICSTYAATPNISSGILDEYGVDRSYQKSYTVYANVEGLTPKKATQWVIVTGAKPREGAKFVTGLSTPIPMFVLHDPPGDASSTSLKKGFSANQLISYSDLHIKGGAGLDVELSPAIETKLSAGVGFQVQMVSMDMNWTAKAHIQSGGQTDWTRTTFWNWQASEEIKTGDGWTDVGRDADIFIGAGENFTFTEGDNIDVINGTCDVRKTKVILFNQNGFSSSFYYSRSHIRDVLIPSLQELYTAAPRGTDTSKIMDYILAWKQMLAWDDSIKKTATLDPAQGNRSFGGADYTYSYQTDSVTHYEFKYAVWLEESLEGGIDFNVGAPATGVRLKLLGTQMLEMDRIAGINSGGSGHAEDWTHDSSTAYSYTLSDDDAGDYFSVDIKKSPGVFGPIFSVRGGVSGCPYEPWDTNGVPTMSKHDRVAIFANPPVREKVSPEKPATFAVALANQSDEQRWYTLSLDNTSNYGGAIVRASGVPINTGIQYAIGAGQTQNVILSVERGPVKYQYDNLRLIAGPRCIPLEDGIADTVSISVHFESPCSDITIDEPLPGWKAMQGDTTLLIALGGYQINISETDSVFEMWMEYRQVGRFTGPWTRAIGTDVLNVGVIKDSARTYKTWLIKNLPDGNYEIRGVTHCRAGYGYSAVIPGTIDRTPPVVMTYLPKSGVLTFGGDISVTFNEDIDVQSIKSDSVRLEYVTGLLDPIRITTTVSSNTLLIQANDLHDNEIVRAYVGGIKDLLGNALVTPLSWQFLVNRSGFRLSEESVSLIKPWGNPGSFTVKASNGTSEQGTLVMEKMPPWLSWTTPGDDTLNSKSTKTLEFSINPSVKRDTLYRDSILVRLNTYRDTLLVSLRAVCMPPDWTVDTSAFANIMTVTAQVYFDNATAPSADTNVIVAAFVGTEVRGVARLQLLGSRFTGGFVFLPVYSNASSNEKVRFKIFNPGNCTIYNVVTPQLIFASGTVLGTPSIPTRLTASVLVSNAVLETPVNHGWTWFSFNLKPEDNTPGGILANINPTANDVLKGFDSYAQYFVSDSGTGWFGSLAELSHRNSYMIRSAAGGRISLSGTSINVDTVVFTLVKGWNWISYLPTRPMSPTEAFARITVSSSRNGEVIMSQNQYAQYVYPLGWFGTLTKLYPGIGYRYNAQTKWTYTYPSSGPSPIGSKTAIKGGIDGPDRMPSLVVSGGPGWSVDPAQFQHSMTITAAVDIGGIASVNDSDVVAVFVGDTCRGVASALYFDGHHRNEFFIMAFSNLPNGETMRFMFYDAKSKAIRDIGEQVRFAVDATMGTVTTPYVLHAGAILGVDGKPLLPTVYALHQNYPNPFNPATDIRYDLPQESKVTLKIYNTLGQLISTLTDEVEPAGFKSKKFNMAGAGLASGVYFYRLEATSTADPAKHFSDIRKMLLIK